MAILFFWALLVKIGIEKGEFISIEDLKQRTSVNKNALNSLKSLVIIEGIQGKNQLSLFDGLF